MIVLTSEVAAPGDSELLRAPSRACLFVSRGGSSPRGWPFTVRWIDGALWCSTYGTSAKMRHVSNSDQATCLLFKDEESAYPYAVVHGRVTALQPTPEAVDRWMAGNVVASPERATRHRDRLLRGKRVFLVLLPDADPTFFAAATDGEQGPA